MKKLIMGWLMSLALLACASSETDPKPPTTPTPVTDLATLANTHWRLVDLCGKAEPADAGITLGFEEAGRISGKAAVNRYSGVFQIVDGKLKSGPFITTRMAGPPEAMERERLFLAALEVATRVARSADGDLVISVAEKDLPVRFAAAEAP